MILVTGATGTIGREAVKALRARGAQFKIGARNVEKGKKLGLDAIAFDFEKPATFDAALQRVDRVFLLPPVAENQVATTEAFIDAAKKAGVKHVVKLSVMGADQEPGITLGRMHREGEKVIEASGLAWTFLRPTFFAQNFVNYYGADPSKDATIYLAHGEGKAAYVDARDVGEVAAAALTTVGHEGRIYDLTGPEAHSDAEMASILSAALKHKYEYVAVPQEAASKAMKDMGAPQWLVDAYAELDMTVRNGWASNVAPGVKQVLGRNARTMAEWARDLTAPRK